MKLNNWIKDIIYGLCILLLLTMTVLIHQNNFYLTDEKNNIVHQLDSLIIITQTLTQKIISDSLQMEEYKHFIKAISDANYTFYVTVTMYNAEENQCDSDPLITADNTFIVKENINELKYIAISRDLHKRYGGPFNFDDKILLLNAGDKNGVYIIKDLMNKRFKRRIDILESEFVEEYKFKNAFIIDVKSPRLSKDLSDIIN